MLGENTVDITTTLTESAGDGHGAVAGVLWFGPRAHEGRLHVMAGVATIGRDARSTMALEGSALSRSHAEIRKEGPIFTICDRRSRNGTFVNAASVEHAVLREGDVIRVGEWVGIFGQHEPDAHRVGELAPGLWGGAALGRRLVEAERAVRAGLSLSIHGETGTGKELVARAAHHWSGRSGRFCAINCAAIPEGLAESELFGHRKGAFTGAERSSLGYFRSAERGTLLLDEVSELSPVLQAKLLRALQERVVLPVGEQEPAAFDVQVVCAAQPDLRELAKRGQFRLDLMTRLSGFSVELPSLRARLADVVPLFRHFLRRCAASPGQAVEGKLLESLLLYGWPGNVRELEQVARELQALHSDEPVLRRAHLPSFVRSCTAGATEAPSERQRTVERSRRQRDQELLSTALRETGGNVSEAAKRLQFSRQRAYRLLKGSGAAATGSDDAE